jgi:hypothetical protein
MHFSPVEEVRVEYVHLLVRVLLFGAAASLGLFWLLRRSDSGPLDVVSEAASKAPAPTRVRRLGSAAVWGVAFVLFVGAWVAAQGTAFVAVTSDHLDGAMVPTWPLRTGILSLALVVVTGVALLRVHGRRARK